MNKPFFSVVLPTYNRASYLPFAIKSVLNQTCTDFELIVSNNCSTDETEQVVREFDDKRIKYIKTAQNIQMNQHWEFALNHASGEYITFLSDDDAHSSIYLETFYEAIEETNIKLLACKIAHYYFQEYRGYGTTFPANSLISSCFTGNKTIISSKEIIKNLFSNIGYPPYPFPQLSNSAYHHSIFTSIRNRIKHILPGKVLGDIYTSVLTSNEVDSVMSVDLPLFVHGFSKDSASSIDSEEKKKMFLEAYPNDFTKTDLPLKISGANWFPTLVKAKEDLSPDLDYLTIDWSNYFIKSYEGILGEELNGYNRREERAEFFSVLQKQDKALQKEVIQNISNSKDKISHWLRCNLGNTGFANLLRKIVRKESQMVLIEGNSEFSNILECAKFIDKNFIATHKTLSNM